MGKRRSEFKGHRMKSYAYQLFLICKCSCFLSQVFIIILRNPESGIRNNPEAKVQRSFDDITPITIHCLSLKLTLSPSYQKCVSSCTRKEEHNWTTIHAPYNISQLIVVPEGMLSVILPKGQWYPAWTHEDAIPIDTQSIRYHISPGLRSFPP